MSSEWLDWGKLLGSIAVDLFGGSKKGGKPQWDQIQKLIELDTLNNRINRQGLFSGWDFTQDPTTGQWTQTQTIPESMQSGVNRLIDRSSNGVADMFSAPEQFNSLMDAKMANQMSRHGLLSEYPDLTRIFGESMADQLPHSPANTYPDSITGVNVNTNTPNDPYSDMGGTTGDNYSDAGLTRDIIDIFMNQVTNNAGDNYSRDNENKLGWQGDKGLSGWDAFDNSGYNPFAWRDNYNASDVEKLFGQNDIGSLGGMNAAGVIGDVAGGIFGIPLLGKLFEKLWGYNPNKNYFSPTDPYDPYGVSDVPIRADEGLPSSGLNEGDTSDRFDPVTGNLRGYEYQDAGLGTRDFSFDQGFGRYNNLGGFGNGIIGGNWGSGGMFGGGTNVGGSRIKDKWWMLSDS